MSYSRRLFLKMSAAIALPAGIDAQATNSTEPYADLAAADEWMMQWMQAPHAAAGALRMGRFADPMYFLTDKITWAPNAGQNPHKPVRVPVGFVTDFASIPRIFWSMLPADGLYTFPAIVHDYLYWEQSVEREEADEIFRLGLEDFKIDSVTVLALHQGVRIGGRAAWRENARLKKAGARRILRKMPSDPTIRWADWKIRSDVF